MSSLKDYTGGHLSNEQIADLVAGEREASIETAEIAAIDHLAQCTDCGDKFSAAEIALLDQVDRGDQQHGKPKK